MSIGQRLAGFFKDNEPFKSIYHTTRQINLRRQLYNSTPRNRTGLWAVMPLLSPAVETYVFISFVLLGVGGIGDYKSVFGDIEVSDNISQMMGDLLGSATQQPAIREIMQSLGTIAYDPFKGMMDYYGGKEDIDTDEFVRNFYGYLMGLPLLGNMMNVGGQTLTAGFIDNLGKPIEDSYWTLGLGFMGWQGVSPLLSESVLQLVTRQAKRKFRQTRFKTGDVLDLLAINEISWDDAVRALEEEGWRGSDIPNVIKLSRKNLTRSEVDKLFELGAIDSNKYIQMLKGLGYSSEAIQWILFLGKQEETKTNKGVSYSLAKKAYKLRSITDEEFKRLLSELGYSDEAIKLELTVINFEEETELKELTTSQLEQAFKNNIINDTEVLQALKNAGYEPTSANLLLEVWKAKLAPKVLTLNQSSITKAVLSGVLSPSQAYTKLLEIGYKDKDAEIIIASITAETSVNVKVPSEAKIIAALQRGIINESEARQRLAATGYETVDINLLVELATTTEIIEAETKDIEDAFLYSVIDREQASQMLRDIGATDNFIVLRLDTLEKRKARLKVQFNPNQIGLWYRQGLIEENEAVLRLIDLGYERDDARLFLVGVSTAIPQPLSDAAIRDALIEGVINTDKASELYRRLGLSESDILIRLQTLEREAGTLNKQVSIISLMSANRDGIISDEDFSNRLAEMGFSEEDINLYLTIATQRNTNTETKLSKADILKGYRKGKISDAETLALLESKQYTLEEAGFLLLLEGRDVRVDTTFIDIIEGNVDIQTGINQLLAKGYRYEDIRDALLELDQGL